MKKDLKDLSDDEIVTNTILNEYLTPLDTDVCLLEEEGRTPGGTLQETQDRINKIQQFIKDLQNHKIPDNLSDLPSIKELFNAKIKFLIRRLEDLEDKENSRKNLKVTKNIQEQWEKYKTFNQEEFLAGSEDLQFSTFINTCYQEENDEQDSKYQYTILLEKIITSIGIDERKNWLFKILAQSLLAHYNGMQLLIKNVPEDIQYEVVIKMATSHDSIQFLDNYFHLLSPAVQQKFLHELELKLQRTDESACEVPMSLVKPLVDKNQNIFLRITPQRQEKYLRENPQKKEMLWKKGDEFQLSILSCESSKNNPSKKDREILTKDLKNASLELQIKLLTDFFNYNPYRVNYLLSMVSPDVQLAFLQKRNDFKQRLEYILKKDFSISLVKNFDYKIWLNSILFYFNKSVVTQHIRKNFKTEDISNFVKTLMPLFKSQMDSEDFEYKANLLKILLPLADETTQLTFLKDLYNIYADSNYKNDEDKKIFLIYLDSLPSKLVSKFLHGSSDKVKHDFLNILITSKLPNSILGKDNLVKTQPLKSFKTLIDAKNEEKVCEILQENFFMNNIFLDSSVFDEFYSAPKHVKNGFYKLYNAGECHVSIEGMLNQIIFEIYNPKWEKEGQGAIRKKLPSGIREIQTWIEEQKKLGTEPVKILQGIHERTHSALKKQSKYRTPATTELYTTLSEKTEPFLMYPNKLEHKLISPPKRRNAIILSRKESLSPSQTSPQESTSEKSKLIPE